MCKYYNSFIRTLILKSADPLPCTTSPALTLTPFEDDWTWSETNRSNDTRLYGQNNRTVLFHPGWSNGTAAVSVVLLLLLLLFINNN
jgi:hypothetical protein